MSKVYMGAYGGGVQKQASMYLVLLQYDMVIECEIIKTQSRTSLKLDPRFGRAPNPVTRSIAYYQLHRIEILSVHSDECTSALSD